MWNECITCRKLYVFTAQALGTTDPYDLAGLSTDFTCMAALCCEGKSPVGPIESILDSSHPHVTAHQGHSHAPTEPNPLEHREENHCHALLQRLIRRRNLWRFLRTAIASICWKHQSTADAGKQTNTVPINHATAANKSTTSSSST